MPERRPNRVRGPGHDEFWSYCAVGELRLQRCDSCGHLSWPPTRRASAAGSAGSPGSDYRARGQIVSWCRFERSYYPELEVPWDTILVELDEGPLFISNPSGFDNDEVTHGMAVHLAFLDCVDDAGTFRLPVFEKTS